MANAACHHACYSRTGATYMQKSTRRKDCGKRLELGMRQHSIVVPSSLLAESRVCSSSGNTAVTKVSASKPISKESASLGCSPDPWGSQKKTGTGKRFRDEPTLQIFAEGVRYRLTMFFTQHLPCEASEDRLRLCTGILSEPPVASVATLCLCRPLSSEATDCAESATFRGLHFHLSLRW